MDYKKKYEDALERARKVHTTNVDENKKSTEYIFPELKESEDEKMIKFISHELACIRATDEKGSDRYEELTNAIAWLEMQGKHSHCNGEVNDEALQQQLQIWFDKGKCSGREEVIFHPENFGLQKQGEQKPNVNCLLSWSEIDEKMLQSLEGIVKDYWAKAEREKNEIKIREASNVSFFLKTIQKSPLCWIKCSDRLPNRDGTYFVVTDGRHNDVYDIARYDSIEGWHKASEIIYWMPIPQLNNKSIIEQKPTDKIEPKFKVGDWVTNGIDFTFKVMSIKDDMYYRDDNYFIDIKTADKTFRLWTIQDAKDGDVLASDGGNVCLFDGTVEEGIYPFAYCGITRHGFEFYDRKLPFTHDYVYPANELQRNVLFQKMKEAGYAWDAKKKKLKKIEQKSPESRQETKPNGGIVYEDFNEGDGYYKVNLAYLSKSQVEIIENLVASWQNPTNNTSEWSEEDERICQCLIKDQGKALNEVKNDKYGHSEIISDLKEMYRERIDWLKSLKQRMKGKQT